jgi:hypothetical protein
VEEALGFGCQGASSYFSNQPLVSRMGLDHARRGVILYPAAKRGS